MAKTFVRTINLFLKCVYLVTQLSDQLEIEVLSEFFIFFLVLTEFNYKKIVVEISCFIFEILDDYDGSFFFIRTSVVCSFICMAFFASSHRIRIYLTTYT